MHRSVSSFVAALALGLLPATVPFAHADTAIVGTGAGCTHATVQAGINAVQGAPESSQVRITRSATYAQQALVVSTSRALEITGGYATCAQATADVQKTTLDGAGGATASVLRIITSGAGTVTLRKLRIRGGDPAGENAGGGVFFGGSGTLEVNDTEISGNIAGNGGGIYAGGGSPGARLIIGANVAITGNEARFSGGGVFVDGLAMSMLEPDSFIAFNSAFGTSSTGYGGGLVIRSLDDRAGVARIGGGGIGTSGVIFGNEARAGGGVAVLGAEDALFDPARLVLFTTQANRRAAVRDNFASVAGGGLFVEFRSNFGTANDAGRSIAELWNAELTGNVAPSGAAVYLAEDDAHDEGGGGELFVNSTRPDDALDCDMSVPCGEISGNRAQNAASQPTDGAVIQAQEECNVVIGSGSGGVRIRGNAGGRLIDVQPGGLDGPTNGLTLANSEIVDNEFSLNLLRAQQRPVRLRELTIAGNTAGSSQLLAINGDLELRRSILWQPGLTLLSQSGGTRTVSSVIASESTSLGGPPNAVIVEPRFVDPERDDYRLRAASPAVDAVPIAGGRDVTGAARDRDLVLKPDGSGPRDLGAFERGSIGNLMLNRAFDGDLHLWNPVTPGASTFDPSEDVSGLPGSGSAKVSGQPVNGNRVVGSRQCVHLPGPGLYTLTTFGKTEFGPTAQRDSVVLQWEFRRDGSEQCDGGPADDAGDLLVTRQSTFSDPASPAVISVPPADFTPNSSITVSLVVIDNGLTVPRRATGWFDVVSLALTPFEAGDELFADGFE